MALDNKTRMVRQLVVNLFFLTLIFHCFSQATDSQTAKDTVNHFPQKIDYAQRLKLHEEHRIINDIQVKGNILITKDAILNRLSLKVGEVFNVNYTASMIKNLYKLGYFHQIQIYGQPVGDDKIDITLVVQEKPKLKDVTFKGNSAFSEKELKTELKIEKIPTLVQAELKALMNKIKKFYHKKNYHNVQVSAELTNTDDGRVSVEFTIKEGKKTYVTQISFTGNKHVSGKRLKRALFTKEDWILGVLDHSGSYNPEMIEGDKYMIEDLYKNHGFINAKVTDSKLIKDPVTGNFHLKFSIHEGDRYRIKEVNVQGNDVVSEQRLREIIPLYAGQIYSLENIRTALENMRMLWGEHGYLFADIEPHIETHDEEKTVSITFNADLKDQVYLNRLTIRGNKKTRDKVIRRQVLLEEGELITNHKMELSKACVGLLNYFDTKNGVNWKTTRLDATHADLDLILNEVKTGHFQANLSYGGSPTARNTPQTGLNFTCNLGDRNVIGSGIALLGNVEISKKYRSFMASATNPWILDKPIRGTANGFIKSSEYEDQITIAENPPFERAVGGVVGVGYVSKLLGGMMVDGKIQFEKITFDDQILAAKRLSPNERIIAQLLLNRNFQAGTQISFIGTLGQDKRNSMAFPTNGHHWSLSAQMTIPGWAFTNQPDTAIKTCNFNYFKTELDIAWYTPLINEHDLVLCIHGNLGFVHPFKDKEVPWRQLYHVGGPTSVRGYLYGQVGPTWMTDSLGATKAMFVNVEFIVPLSSNLNTRGVVFYDGGAGWDTPYANEFSIAARKLGLSFEKNFYNNNFFYRHSVGIGVRMKSPTPLQVDFGIKLNPSKKYRKHLTELHLNMEHAF